MPELSAGSESLYTKDVVSDTKCESYVLVLYVGGTIGMMKNTDGFYVPMPKTLVKRLQSDLRMHDSSYLIKRKYSSSDTTLVLPEANTSRRIMYTIYEYEQLIDSSNITADHWDKIATDIFKNYKLYDGFVILHGTDTLSYTASALSFMLENLGKSVVLTGSQIPMFDARSDGSDNFIGSLIIAGSLTIPEVTVFFHNKLMRGNRTIKFSSNNLDPFHSPNAPDIAKLNTEIVVNYDEILYPNKLKEFTVQKQLDEHVGILRIFPNIQLILVKSFLKSGLRGIVLETFGCGNFMSVRNDLVLEIEDAVQKGIIIVNCTQCYTGEVANNYESGQVLWQVGVLSGHDMTTEAALSKLSYILTKDEWDLETKKKMFCRNLRGEMSYGIRKSKHTKNHLLERIAKTLGIRAEDEVIDIGNSIFPALVMNAVRKSDFNMLDKLRDYGVNISAQNIDGRTALHVASSIGNIRLIKYLLKHGCMVHVKDDEDKTPLMDAVLNDNHDAIRVLRSCGAHFARPNEQLGENLCSAAFRGRIIRLESYFLAGVGLDQTDFSGRTPLHTAVLASQVETIKFLLGHGSLLDSKDALGQTVIDYALMIKNDEIVELFCSTNESSVP